MLQIAISAGLMLGIFKILEPKNKQYDLAEIDLWVGAAVVVAPAFIVYFLRIAFAEQPGFMILPIALLIYFLVPFFCFKKLMEYPTKMAALYSVFVPIVVLVVEFTFQVLLSAQG